jgi:hypothetical protein
MQIQGLDPQGTGPLASARSGRRRRRVLLGAGALALVLSTIGTVAAVAGRSSPAAQAHAPSATQAAPNTIATAPQSPSGPWAPNATSSPAPVLADGTYPIYINKVDVKGATITVDVIQVFANGEAAINAAVEDGMSRSEAKYLYVYILNQNPRLRTLRVARDVTIHFADGCDASPVLDKALTELANRTATFNDMWYYDIVVANGKIHEITQRIAEAAC